MRFNCSYLFRQLKVVLLYRFHFTRHFALKVLEVNRQLLQVTQQQAHAIAGLYRGSIFVRL